MKHTIINSILAGAVLLGSQAGAAVLFTDDFSSTTSGTGFSNNWSAGTISGGQLSTSGTAFRNLTTSIPTATADFWFVSNLTITGPSSSWAGISFFDGTTEDMFFGSDSGSSTWEFDTRGIGDTNTAVANHTGTETLLVAHVTGSSIEMWINPTNTSNPAALGTAHAGNTSNPITNRSQWTRLRIAAGSPTITVNDMTAATTFGEAIPEPGVTMLAALLATAALLRRRRS